jgi:competence protein ComFC
METAKSKSIFKLLKNGASNLLWPAVCINCRAAITDNNDRFCHNCWRELLSCTTDSYCRRCGHDTTEAGIVNNNCPACIGRQFHFESIVRCGKYADVLKSMILAFKNSRCELSSILGELADTTFHNSSFHDNIDYLVPVPLHWKRQFTRGYNQAKLIAKKLSGCEQRLNTNLVRIRNTAAQPSMTTPAARERNVADAFAVRKGHDFAGKKICLIDDIKTTGATLNECAKTLKQAGAEKIYALVLAVAGQNPG